MNDADLINDFKHAFRRGASYLAIYSRRQDVGLAKCERGVSLGYLKVAEREIDSQETHWVYYWTDKAKMEFKEGE